MLPSEIHHHICQVYGENAMSDGMVRKWVRMFNEGRENVHDEARSGRPSLVQAEDFNKEDHVHRSKFGRILDHSVYADCVALRLWILNVNKK